MTQITTNPTNQLLNEKTLTRVAAAVRKLCTAASMQLGVDCFLHAYLAKSILDKLGVDSRIVIGESAWRVGSGEHDVLSHLYTGFNGSAVGFHAWLVIDDTIFDPTLYSMPIKIKVLDAQDGHKTTISWSTNALIAKQSDSKSFEEVVSQESAPGAFHYLQIQELEDKVKAGFKGDREDEEYAWLCYLNVNQLILGPNQTVE